MQVLAGVTCPELLQTPQFPRDVKEKAQFILKSLRGESMGEVDSELGFGCFCELLTRTHSALMDFIFPIL